MAELALSDAEGQITILLEEYRSLRDEAKQRVSERMTLLGLLTAAAAVIASTHNAVWAYVVAALFLVIGALVWLRSWRILDKLSQRIAALETEINDLAQTAYRLGTRPCLLRWETQLQCRREQLAEAGRLKGAYGKLVHPK
jgi:predicted membrane-bound spermidine synthase